MLFGDKLEQEVGQRFLCWEMKEELANFERAIKVVASILSHHDSLKFIISLLRGFYGGTNTHTSSRTFMTTPPDKYPKPLLVTRYASKFFAVFLHLRYVSHFIR